MFTIKPRTRIQEGASWEDIQDGDCYETGYEISNSDGEIIYDFANEDIKYYYEYLNRQDEENTMKNTNATAKLNEANLINTADDIIDIFEELLDRFAITLPDKWREGEEDEARIFGDTYYELENKIIERLRKEDPPVEDVIEMSIVSESLERKQRILDEYAKTTKIVDFAKFLKNEYGPHKAEFDGVEILYDDYGVKIGGTYLSWNKFAETVCSLIEDDKYING